MQVPVVDVRQACMNAPGGRACGHEATLNPHTQLAKHNRGMMLLFAMHTPGEVAAAPNAHAVATSAAT